jgi:hypothetical protein
VNFDLTSIHRDIYRNRKCQIVRAHSKHERKIQKHDISINIHSIVCLYVSIFQIGKPPTLDRDDAVCRLEITSADAVSSLKSSSRLPSIPFGHLLPGRIFRVSVLIVADLRSDEPWSVPGATFVPLSSWKIVDLEGGRSDGITPSRCCSV